MSKSVAKLYYTASSCGAASFIAAFTGDVKIDFEQVNIGTHITASGDDYYKINPKGNVPALVVGDVLLNEGSAILQWIADQAPKSGLAPANGTIERYQLQNYLNYTASEVHANSGPLFYPTLQGEARENQLKKLNTKFDYLNKNVLNGNKKFLLGDNFTVADSYLYIVLSWHPYVKASLDDYSNLKSYFEGIKALPNVIAAHKKMSELPAAPAS